MATQKHGQEREGIFSRHNPVLFGQASPIQNPLPRPNQVSSQSPTRIQDRAVTSGPYKPISTLTNAQRHQPVENIKTKFTDNGLHSLQAHSSTEEVQLVTTKKLEGPDRAPVKISRPYAIHVRPGREIGLKPRYESTRNSNSDRMHGRSSIFSSNPYESFTKRMDNLSLSDSSKISHKDSYERRTNEKPDSPFGIGLTLYEIGKSHNKAMPSAIENKSSSDFSVKSIREDRLTAPNESLVESLQQLLTKSSQTNGKTDEICSSDREIKGLSVQLMDHQVEGLKFLRQRENRQVQHKGGLLCDDMGLGKTIQALALIVSHPWDEELHSSTNACKSTLIIAPLALINQWAQEVKSKASGLSVCVHHGASRITDESQLSRFSVVITTYQVIASESNKKGPLFKLDWWRIILDEAHIIKNKAAKTSEACCQLHGMNRWVLTGTPIQNSVEELYSLFKFLHIEPLSDFQNWTLSITNPVRRGKGRLAMKRLQIVLSQIYLRRTKDVLSQDNFKLPPRVIHKRMLKFSKPERTFYDSLHSKLGSQLEKILEDKKDKQKVSYMSVFLLLLRLRQACDHTALATKNFKTDMEEDTRREKKKVKTKAGSATAQEDDMDELADLFSDIAVTVRTCMVCQEQLNEIEKERDEDYCDNCISHFVNRGINSATLSTKMIALLEILKENVTRKTIVFSQFTSMLDIVEPALRDENIKYVRYDGSMKPADRVRSLDTLSQDPEVSVLLCSLKAGAVGLNLTCASQVVLLDPWWNPMISEQAIDRVHRIGQTRSVDVHELIIEESVETRILELQAKKRELANSVLGSKDGTQLQKATKLSLQQIKDLFNHRAELNDHSQHEG
ncbi:SNF2 family N-terminal domain-containing protein [Lipomyces oligophaga]|uniref:SNF2 family N-terminal domain-containing protein n=1 Tax=Lipomyces oligophaga TaxID=45792 RepID=UPI0034CDDF88